MGVAEWAAFFATPAGNQAFGKIIYDIIDELKSQEEKAGGLKRIGRRPARSAMRYQEVMDLVFPQEFSNDPFCESMAREMRARGLSQGQMAVRLHCTQGHISRILTGERPLTLEFIEAAAKVLNFRPWRFPEWRAMYFGALIEEVMLEAPNLGTVIFKSTRKSRARLEGADVV